MEFIQTIAAFVLALGVLIFVHEYGHFWVARRCGVKVLRFSIGFGRPLLSRRDKQGTEFVLCAIPLGGYVRMLDEREGNVPEEELPQTFNRKPVLQRMAIVAAGPVVNLSFAAALYWMMFVWGVTTVIPVVGTIEADSPAELAGFEYGVEIVSVDERVTNSWKAVNFALVSRMGDSGDILFGVTAQDSSYVEKKRISVESWMTGEAEQSPLFLLGISPVRPKIEPVLGKLMPGGAAIQGGLESGDQILSAAGAEVADWAQWVAVVQSHPDKLLPVELLRGGEVLQLNVRPELIVDARGREVGRIGAMPFIPEDFGAEYQRVSSYGPVESVGLAVTKVWERSALTLMTIGKMVSGLISVDSLSGPITIAKVAGQTASYGPEAFLSFMAYLSISLGILNLLPIPVLDGGHLFYYVIELLKGSPVSDRMQAFSARIGMIILMSFMLLAIYNDIARL